MKRARLDKPTCPPRSSCSSCRGSRRCARTTRRTRVADAQAGSGAHRPARRVRHAGGHAVASDPRALWRVVDLSYGWARPSDAIVRYCANGDWARSRSTLADCAVSPTPHPAHQHCPELVSLDVSGTSKMTLAGMKPLGERLTELTLDREAATMGATNQLVSGMLTQVARRASPTSPASTAGSSVTCTSAAARRCVT